MQSFCTKCRNLLEHGLFTTGLILLLYYALSFEPVGRMLNLRPIQKTKALTHSALLAMGSPLELNTSRELLMLSIALSVGAFLLRYYCQTWGAKSEANAQAAEAEASKLSSPISSELVSSGMYMLSSQAEREDLLRKLRDIQKKLDHA